MSRFSQICEAPNKYLFTRMNEEEDLRQMAEQANCEIS
jgi:hypothetical protein